jgi:hypothetical protein
MYRQGTPRGVGDDPAAYWSGPDDPDFHVLRLDPWRVQVLRARDVARSELSGRIWRPDRGTTEPRNDKG